MNYAGILLLLLGVMPTIFPMSLGIEVNITDTRLATTDLNWRMDPNDGSGWDEMSNADETGVPFRTYQVCNLRTLGQNNWLRTNFIPLEEKPRNLYVEIKFNIRSCKDFPNVHTCKSFFNLYYMEASDPERVFNTTMYRKIYTISASSANSQRNEASVETKLIKTDNANAKGIYIAFQDTGACMLIFYVRVYYKKCAKIVKNFVIFPSTPAGSGVSFQPKTGAKCTANAEPVGNLKDSSMRCSSEGEWESESESVSCQCSPGFQPGEGFSKCSECPQFQYKSSAGNGGCFWCPANSLSLDHGSAQCPCKPGYFRAFTDGPSSSCAKPPSEPETVQYALKETSVDIKWSPPDDFGGRNYVFYSISCQKCDSAYSLCSDCDDDVIYHPKQQFLTDRSVSIRSLSLRVFYRFRIFSYNDVSAASGAEPAYAQVMLKTSVPVPGAISIVRVIQRTSSEILINWEAPSVPNGKILEYEIQYGSSRRKSLISQATTKSQSFRITHLRPKTSFIIQVRAKNEAGFGPFGRSILVATLPSAPSVFGNAATLEISHSDNVDLDVTSSPNSDVITETSYYLPAALTIGVLMALILAITMTLLLKKARRKRTRKLNRTDVEFYPFFDTAADLLRAYRNPRSCIDPRSCVTPDPVVFEFTKEIDSFSIETTEMIGSGKFGNVYKGYLHPASTVHDGTISTTISSRCSSLKVAIKVLKKDANPEERREFLQKALVMGQFLHPNVIKLEGVVTRTTPLMIVTEYMANGSLDEFLENRRLRGMALEVFQLVNLVRDVADGMRYLSDAGHVHGNLAARNILVNDQLVCKVSNFGSSRIWGETEEAEHTITCNAEIRWSAPESLTQRTVTSASDVWSYGVVMWEALTHGGEPYRRMTNHNVMHCIERGYRLPPPAFCPRVLHNLMLNCWFLDRRRRPTFRQIVAQLDSALVSPERLQDTINNVSIQPEDSMPEPLDILSLCQWLEDMNMAHYQDVILRYGLVTVEHIVRLTRSQLDEMGITEPSMQNILLNGARYLRGKLQEASNIEIGIRV